MYEISLKSGSEPCNLALFWTIEGHDSLQSDKNNYRPIALSSVTSKVFENVIIYTREEYVWSTTGLGSSTIDQVVKYTKYPKYIPSTSTGQVLIF